MHAGYLLPAGLELIHRCQTAGGELYLLHFWKALLPFSLPLHFRLGDASCFHFCRTGGYPAR